MHRPQEQVRAWHQAMGDTFPAPGEAPIDITRNAELRIKLIEEEFSELIDALGFSWDGHFADGGRGLRLTQDHDPDIVAAIDALADIQFVLSGACDTWGIDLEPFFDEVVRSNMTKVGGPVREDGKRLKPDTYEPPQIESMVEARQALYRSRQLQRCIDGACDCFKDDQP